MNEEKTTINDAKIINAKIKTRKKILKNPLILSNLIKKLKKQQLIPKLTKNLKLRQKATPRSKLKTI
ncbi:MAG: hypothetical protein ACTSPH_06765 [Promethearchaeota archaeon]